MLLPTVTFVQLRDQLPAYQGEHHIYFAGGWTNWYDSQESSLLSASHVVQLMTGSKLSLNKLHQNDTSVITPNPFVTWIDRIAPYAPEQYKLQLKKIAK